MGPAGLTAVFGMGTGGAPPAWLPGKADTAGPPAASKAKASDSGCDEVGLWPHADPTLGSGQITGDGPAPPRRRPRGGERRWGWPSRLAVGTGPLRRSRVVHARPIDP